MKKTIIKQFEHLQHVRNNIYARVSLLKTMILYDRYIHADM